MNSDWRSRTVFLDDAFEIWRVVYVSISENFGTLRCTNYFRDKESVDNFIRRLKENGGEILRIQKFADITD